MLPSIKFQDVPSFQLQGPKLERETDTKFLPYSMPAAAGPRRPANHTVPFPLVMYDPSTEEKVDLLPSVNGSTTDYEHEEEEKADSNRYSLPNIESGPCSMANQLSRRPPRYEQFASDWQRVYWDEVQTRPSPFIEYENRNNPCKRKTCSRIITAHKTNTTEDRKAPLVVNHTDASQVKQPATDWQFTRPMPGYCGHVPRFPVKPQPGLCLSKPEFLPSSALAYRLYPTSEYTKESPFAHMGPLSKTVTTTHPFNPYSKVDRWEWKLERLLRKRKRITKS